MQSLDDILPPKTQAVHANFSHAASDAVRNNGINVAAVPVTDFDNFHPTAGLATAAAAETRAFTLAEPNTIEKEETIHLPIVHQEAASKSSFLQMLCEHCHFDARWFDHQSETAFYQQVCQLLSALVEGILKLNVAQAKNKQQLGLETHTLATTGNNPLNYAVDANQAIELLLRPRYSAFMNPETAVEQTLEGLLQHQACLFQSMQTAVYQLVNDILADSVEPQTQTWYQRCTQPAGFRNWRQYRQKCIEWKGQPDNPAYARFLQHVTNAYQVASQEDLNLCDL